MQGIEFNLALIEEDKQIGFKKGYKVVVACHSTYSSGQRDLENSGASIHTNVNMPNE